MKHAFAQIPELQDVDPAAFRREILPQNKPVVLRGAVRHWPAVQAGLASPTELGDYIKRADLGKPVDTYVGEPAIGGLFFYRDDMRGFNFERRKERIGASIDRLFAHLDDPEPPAIYVQSTPVPENLPRFAQENVLDLVSQGVPPRIWIGNNITVAAHYDLSDNIACVVGGRRRFTLFPPEQLANLYVGPLDFTPAGPPVSMVSLDEPDLERYPRFADALAVAQTADLEAGDAIYIPYFWWHHVRSLERFNVLVNYWWNDARPPLRSPYDCLLHAMLALRELPAHQREAWRNVFDYYVFQTHGDPVAHLALESRGGLGPMAPERASQLQMMLLRSLTRAITGR
jgi:hypothetical protein